MMTLKVVFFCVFSRNSFVGGRIKDVLPTSCQEFLSGEFKQCYNRMKISEKSRWLTYYILGLIGLR
jgi:hypothetical protein